MNYDFLPTGGSSSNFPKKSNSGQLSSDLFSSNPLYSNSTNLFQSSVDKNDAMFFNTTSLRANGTTEKSDYFFRENGPSIKSAFGKDHFSNVPPLTTGRGQISEIFSTTEKTNSSPFPRNSEKDVFPTSNGPMNFLNQTNRSLNSNTYVSENSTISSSATGDLVSMPPQAGRLSAFPQISQQQSQVATAAAAASSNSRTGAFVGSIGGAGSSVGSGAPTGASGNGGSVVGAGSSGTAAAAGSQFSLQQAVANNVTTVSSGLPGSSGGGVLPSAAVNRSLYNQQPQHHMTNSNSLGFTSPSSRMSPNSFSASLHQQASFAGLTSATKRSNSPSANAFNHTFSTNIQPGRGGAHSYGSVSPNLQNTNSLIQINSSNSAQNGRDSNSQVGNIAKLDPQDFPALSQKHNSMGMGLLGREYLNMVSKMGGEPSSEFTMQNEDFPALPGSGLGGSKSRSLVYQTGSMDGGGGGGPSGTGTNSGGAFGSLASGDDGCQFVGNQSSSTAYRPGSAVVEKLEPQSGSLDASSTKKGIQTSGDGLVTNIPRGMVTDQFGIVGLLTFIRAAERDSNLVQLALGSDLQNLGLNLSSQDLFSTFQSPFAETPCRPQDIDFFVPAEYLTNLHIRERLAPIKLSKYGEDTLFYLFYTNINDVLQLAAAAELYANDWRYHKGERMWLTRAPGFQATKFETYEQGTYLFFDPKQWRKVPKEFRLEYDKLEDKPQLPNANNYHPAHSQVH